MSVLDDFILVVNSESVAESDAKRDRDPSVYDDWSELISFVPPAAVQQNVNGRGLLWSFDRIVDGWGAVNLDYYGVLIKQLPAGFATAGDLFEYVRQNLSSFFDPSISAFVPYDPAVDPAQWSTIDPSKVVGSTFQFKINLAPTMGGWSNLEDGTVVCTYYVPKERWRFSTVRSPADKDHPVSGNREFGISTTGSAEFVLYTKGADRVSGVFSANVPTMQNMVFNGADALWTSWQVRVAALIATTVGTDAAVIQEPDRNRPSWSKVSDLYRPSEAWL